jgi:protease-4
MSTTTTVERIVLLAVVTVGFAALSWWLFVAYPDSLHELLGILVGILAVLTALRFGANAADSLAAPYNVAEVAVEGPITRDGGGGPAPTGAIRTPADDIVEQIDRADDDGSVEALVVKLNTPGGEIVPSEDIRLAVERFDGPTVGYALDTCASGGYDIASGCDEIWAREGSIVGSIGVIGSRVNVSDLADRLGVSYERFAAGEYKDAGQPLSEIDEDERAYIQGLVDDYYEQFVETVAQRREIDAAAVRDTEARVYLGDRACELGLVDELGTREDVEDRLEARLDTEATIREFEPQRGLTDRFRAGAQGVAFALGAGVAQTFTGDADGTRFRR